jgi:hypothetical protein
MTILVLLGGSTAVLPSFCPKMERAMHSRQCFALWFGFLFLAVLSLPSLTAEAQVRVPNKSKNTVPSSVPSSLRPSSLFTQLTFDVPANATLDYTGRAWECKHGYHRSGKGCVAVEMPANAAIDYTGHAWECKHGYRRSGKGCVAVEMPANAILDYDGHAWECECGYQRMGDICEKMTALIKTTMYGSSAVRASIVNPQQQDNAKQEVRQIQKQLTEAGFDPGPMDGMLGPRTMKALQHYLATR